MSPLTGPEPDRQWTQQSVRDAVARLSTADGTRLLAAIALHKTPPALDGLALFTRLPAQTVRSLLADARLAGWVDVFERAQPPSIGYVVTAEGHTNLTRLARECAGDVISVDDTVNVNDDQSSTTTMTPAPVVNRRGKPGWCRPGTGVCSHC
jgi:hypothetical protein